MAWTDISSYSSDQYAFGVEWSATNLIIGDDLTLANYPGLAVDMNAVNWRTPNILQDSYHIPGFDDGYQPYYVPSTIAGNIDEPDPNCGGGGGSTRPTSGMVYPRGLG